MAALSEVPWQEEALAIPCGAERLVGILAKPSVCGDTGVVIVVGGPQYRAGSHRQFVLLARTLAAAGDGPDADAFHRIAAKLLEAVTH
jgi:hypothetical protein